MQSQRLELAGPAGAIEAVRSAPDDEASLRGTAVVAHPHPQFGGTMNNKVVQTLARAFVMAGFAAVRFNFRGVGESAGTYDEGRGELQDMLAVVQQAAAEGPLALAGFSFGAFVASQALHTLWEQRPATHAVLVGAAASNFDVAQVPEPARMRTLVVHGEHDDVVPLAAVLDWARPQLLPVTVVPGGAHFFHGQLPLLRELVGRHLQARF
ncbi:alpha/beta hydrolase [Comamonas sp. NLF-1-9]|uniref:alpha/beta hydrolase n=1 Tax=Comamonas sp. NLF-1-9 TaxID=2853163 RepID=UPI001C48DE80|nr:alpha/beta fold hydrolase [Comamonas sp. NLF-1-9]QXL84301.1 alpha/beta hydrolase [Comamonas sp. NLF-1-9]